jgi:hypothetical protein
MRALAPLLAFGALLVTSNQALADARGVGLGVAAGVDIQRGEGLGGEDGVATDQSLSWGFFVDIPLLETFFITPAAMIYELDAGDGDKAALTDVDINFKFIVPLGRIRAGGGVTAGLTTGLGDYLGHYGLLGYFSFNLVANLDAFAMVHWKRLAFGSDQYDNIHGYIGGMFTF